MNRIVLQKYYFNLTISNFIQSFAFLLDNNSVRISSWRLRCYEIFTDIFISILNYYEFTVFTVILNHNISIS
jgi:hypothetical protein